jgi:large subunit ribosomal protein L7/L12
MAEVKRADVLEYLEKATMLEVSELVKEIEEKFGVTAAAPMAMPMQGVAAPGAAAEAVDGCWCNRRYQLINL